MSPHAAVRARPVAVLVEALLLLHVLAVGHVVAVDATVAAALGGLSVVARSGIGSATHHVWIVRRLVAKVVERLCICCGVDQRFCGRRRGWRFYTRLLNVSLSVVDEKIVVIAQ